MVKVEGYANLTKKQEDLLRLGYPSKSLATVTLLTNADPVTFKARAAQKADGVVLASSSVKVAHDKVVFTTKRRTDSLCQYTLEYTVNPEVKTKAEVKVTETATSSNRDVTVSAEYRVEDKAVKAAFVHPNPALKLSATFEKNSHGIGVDGKFDFASHRFVNYNIAHWYTSPEQTVAVKHNGSNKLQYTWGELVLSYFRDVSAKAKVCGVAKYNIPSKVTSIEFGGDYKVDDNMTVRGKVNSCGLLGLALTKKLLPSLNLTLGAQFDTKKIKATSISDYKFGFKLDFNTASNKS